MQQTPSSRRSSTCYVGVDDGYFKRTWRKTVIAAAAHCHTDATIVPCGFRAGFVTVDGADATYWFVRVVGALLRNSVCDEAVVLADTPIYAGFNIVDLDYAREALGTPIISVHHYPPDKHAVKRALEKHFPGETWRLAILEREWSLLGKASCQKGILYIAPYGIGFLEAVAIVCSLQLFTRTPEPLYTAGTIASTLSRLLLGARREANLNYPARPRQHS